MPRIVSDSEKQYAIELMLNRRLGQRDIQRETGLSRPYLRKLAKMVGYQFPRNGFEILGVMCMCTNCGTLFRKPNSKVSRAVKQFCEDECRKAYMKGANHPNWKTGKSASTFSNWIQNQSGYKEWRDNVLERDNFKCIISGRKNDLQVHHIFQKAEHFNPEKALDVNNGITLNRDLHEEIHELIRNGNGFEESLEILKNRYKENELL